MRSTRRSREPPAAPPAVGPVGILFRRAPRDATAPPVGGSTARPRHWTLADAIVTPQFWLLFIVYMFTSIGSFLVSLHQVAFAVDAGFDPLYAASVLGAGSFLALPGVILTGTVGFIVVSKFPE